MHLFEGATIEVLSDPSDLLSPLARVNPLNVDATGNGYQMLIAPGYDPVRLYEDVCPAGYEATWYTFGTNGGAPVGISFVAEVEERSEGLSSWFSPVSQGRNVYDSPTHIAFCSYSNTSGDYRRSHTLTATYEGSSLSGRVSCAIRVNNSGNIAVLDAQSGQGTAQCYGNR